MFFFFQFLDFENGNYNNVPTNRPYSLQATSATLPTMSNNRNIPLNGGGGSAEEVWKRNPDMRAAGK